MPILIKAGETTAERKRVYFQCVDATDGITPETGEAGGQPQVSINGNAFASLGITTLTAIGNGRYYAELADSTVSTAGCIIESRYKSANTAEAVGTTVQTVAFDPHAVANLGLSYLSGDAFSRIGAAGAGLTALGDTRIEKLNVSGTLANTDNASSFMADVSGLATAAALAVTDSVVDSIAAVLAGITSLASWLGALAGKTADSSTLAEIQATTAGETFDNTTDSEEAISEAVAGISGGTGAHAITLYVKDDSANPVAGQSVSIPTAGVQLSAASTGAVSFNLDAGTYTVTVRSSAAYTPESSYTVVVDADGNVTTPADAVLEITAVAIAPPDSADECRVYGYVYDQNNDPVENAVVKIKMYNPPGIVDGGGVAIQSKAVSYTTNASGYWYADLVRSSEFPSDVYWEIDCPAAGYSKVVVVPDESTVSWEDLEEAST